MTEIKGYTPTSEDQRNLVNVSKEFEERVLRLFEAMAGFPNADQRCLAIAITHLQTAFMFANRAIFNPTRIALPEDPVPEEPSDDASSA